MSQAVEREKAHVATSEWARPKTLHVDGDCPRLQGGDARAVDAAEYPNSEWCQYCTGEWSEGASVGGYAQLLGDDDVTDLDDVAAALEDDHA